MFPKLDYIKQLVEGLKFAANKRFVNLEKFAEDAKAKLTTLLANRPNWNQNDETAIDYIKNRPFYDASSVVAEASLEENGDGLPEATYEIGKTYIIEVNGERRELTFMYDTGRYDYYVGFNIIAGQYVANILDADVGYYMYQFCGTLANGEQPSGAVTTALKFFSSEVTRPANIRILEGSIHTLDEKYIPDTIARVGESLLTSPSGTKYQLTVADDGTLTTAAVE